MIIEVAGRQAVAVAQDEASARYDCASTLTGSAAGPGAAGPGRPSPDAVRVLVEIRRNLGGMIMRAMVGGEFRAGADGWPVRGLRGPRAVRQRGRAELRQRARALR